MTWVLLLWGAYVATWMMLTDSGLALAAVVLATNRLGDALRDIANENRLKARVAAGVKRQHLRGTLLAHGGTDAVGTDEQIRA